MCWVSSKKGHPPGLFCWLFAFLSEHRVERALGERDSKSGLACRRGHDLFLPVRVIPYTGFKVDMARSSFITWSDWDIVLVM